MSLRKNFEKEILEKNALNRIKFDKNLNPDDFEICYFDRNSKALKKVKFSEIEIDGDFFRRKSDIESLIPLHRIRKILWKGEIVWDKRRLC
ncbi:MAG: DUF504 domain-containing protein [Candidatus Altiarchaeota archaeon]